MSLTLRQLKYFTAVAEVGRISHAALQLNISQSAVTTAVRELEEMLGQQLFERQPHGVELTRAGRRFLSHAYAVLSAADEAIRMPHEGVNVEGTLTIAATYTVLGYFLPHHLQRFEQLHSQIKVKVHEVVREAIEEGLITQQYDMGVLLTSNVVLRELSLETFFGSQRRLWVPAKHALLEKAEVTLADVAAEPYILLTVDEAAGTAMKYWSKTPYQPQIRLRTSSVEAVRSTVANGLGVTVLSDMVYRPWSLEGKRIETISLRDAVPTMNIGLGWKQGIEFSPAMTAFRDYFRQLFLEPVVHQGRRRPGGWCRWLDMPISAFSKTASNEFFAHANASIEASLHGLGEERRRFSDRSTFSFSRCFSRFIYGMAMVSSTALRHRCAAGGNRLVALTLDGQSLGQMISAGLRIRACAVRCSLFLSPSWGS